MDYGKRAVEAMLDWDFPAKQGDLAVEKAEIFKKSFGGIQLEAALCDKDRYSFVLAGLQIECVAGEQPKERFLTLANRLISSADYLSENLALIELDQQNGIAQIRSSKPDEREDAYYFFELLLSSKNTFSLHRYRKAASEPSRQRIPVMLTRDIVERLIDDVVALWLQK